MALSVARFESTKLTYKLVEETASTTTALIDVTQDSGKIYSLSIENAASQTVFVKLTLTEDTPVVGTTNPEMMFGVAAAANVRWVMPDGVTFTKLSFWTSQNAVKTDSTAPTGGNVKVSLTTS